MLVLQRWGWEHQKLELDCQKLEKLELEMLLLHWQSLPLQS